MQNEYAAGCIVFRDQDGLVLLIHHTRGEWRLPKGRLEAGEKPAEAARREVEEETGIRVRVGEYVATSTYTFVRSGVSEPIDKTIYWFAATLAAPEANSQPVPQTSEGIDEAVWAEVEEAGNRLTFPAEKEMLARALQRRDAHGQRG